MCSISGFISTKPLPIETASRLSSALIFHGTDRGNQSAGISTANGVFKNNVTPSAFINSKQFLQAWQNPSHFFLGHTRFPTSGGKTAKQAQPFHALAHSSVTKTSHSIHSIHNGWYTNEKEIRETFNIDNVSGVDSELVTSFIARYTVRGLPSFLEVTSGPSAIVIQEKGRLYAIRNGNPLVLTHFTIGKHKITAFASTKAQLEQSLFFTFLFHDTPKIYSLEEHQLFEITPTETLAIGSPMEADSRHTSYSYTSSTWNKYDADYYDKKDDQDFWNRYKQENRKSFKTYTPKQLVDPKLLSTSTSTSSSNSTKLTSINTYSSNKGYDVPRDAEDERDTDHEYLQSLSMKLEQSTLTDVEQADFNDLCAELNVSIVE